MNKFYDWLFKLQTKKSGYPLGNPTAISKKGEKNHELNTIWEESSKIVMPEAPDNQLEWIKLQRAIKIAANKTAGNSGNLFGRILLNGVGKRKFALVFSVVILSFFLSTVFIYKHIGTTVYVTNNTEKRSIVLADGSMIQLNSGSKLTVPANFSQKSRTVRLAGEAYFDVQKSPIQFQIHTEIGAVTVLGTEFNVNSRNDRMEVAVNEGRVQVTSTVSQTDSSVFLTKGELCVCESGQFPDIPQQINFNEYPGWLYNKMTINEIELSEVLQEIERRFDVKIQPKDNHLGTLRISGLFEAADLDSLMSSLCILIQKEYRQEKNVITIY